MRYGLRFLSMSLLLCVVGILAVRLVTNQQAAPLPPAIPLTPIGMQYEVITPENAQYLREVHTLRATEEGVTLGLPVYSPDGRFVATSASDKSVRLWDVASGSPIRAFKPDLSLFDFAFSPDSRLLISRSGNKDEFKPHTIDVWDMNTGTHLYALSGYSQAAISPSGQVALLTTAPETEPVLEIHDGFGDTLIKRLDPGASEFFYNADGRFLLRLSDKLEVLRTDTWDTVLSLPFASYLAYHFNLTQNLIVLEHRGQAEVWDIAQQSLVQAFPLDHSSDHFDLMISPNGQTLTIGIPGLIAPLSHIYNISTGAEIHSFTEESSFLFTPDSRLMASVYSADVLRLWDTESYTFAASIAIDGWYTDYGLDTNNFAISPDGRSIAAKTANHSIQLFAIVRKAISTCSSPVLNAENASSLTMLRRFETLAVAPPMISPNSRFIAAMSSSSSLYLWDLTSDINVPTTLIPYDETNTPLMRGFSADSRSFMTIEDGMLIAHDPLTWDIQSTYPAPPDPDPLNRDPHSRMTIIYTPATKPADDETPWERSGNTYTAVLTDAQSGAVLGAFDSQQFGQEVGFVRYDPDGEWVAIQFGDALEVWDIAQQALRYSLTTDDHYEASLPHALSQDGDRFAAVSSEGIQVWDMATGSHLLTLTSSIDIGGPRMVLYNSDRSLLAAQGQWGFALWNAETGQELYAFNFHNETFDILFSPDGRSFITASNHNGPRYWGTTIRLWGLCNP